MLALGLAEFLNGIAQSDARHCGGVFVEEFDEPLGIALARLAHPAPHRLLHNLFFVVDENFSNSKSIVEIVLPDKEIGTDDGGAALARIGGAGELVKNFAGLPGEIAAHHIGGAAVYQVPRINFVMTPDVKIEQLFALGIGGCLARAFQSMMLTAPTRMA